jgi:hypothetical protein
MVRLGPAGRPVRTGPHALVECRRNARSPDRAGGYYVDTDVLPRERLQPGAMCRRRRRRCYRDRRSPTHNRQWWRPLCGCCSAALLTRISSRSNGLMALVITSRQKSDHRYRRPSRGSMRGGLAIGPNEIGDEQHRADGHAHAHDPTRHYPGSGGNGEQYESQPLQGILIALGMPPVMPVIAPVHRMARSPARAGSASTKLHGGYTRPISTRTMRMISTMPTSPDG